MWGYSRHFFELDNDNTSLTSKKLNEKAENIPGCVTL